MRADGERFVTGHTHTFAEWAQFFLLGVGVHAALSVPYFLFVESESVRDFDPRPAVRRAAESVQRSAESGRLVPAWLAAVDAGHVASWVVASVGHELAPAVVQVRHELYVIREMARDVAALLILLTTSPKGAMSA